MLFNELSIGFLVEAQQVLEEAEYWPDDPNAGLIVS